MNVFFLYNYSLQEVFFSYIQNQSNVSISQPDYVSILENKTKEIVFVSIKHWTETKTHPILCWVVLKFFILKGVNVFLLYNLSLQEIFFSYIQNQSNVSISQPDYVSILENKTKEIVFVSIKHWTETKTHLILCWFVLKFFILRNSSSTRKPYPF